MTLAKHKTITEALNYVAAHSSWSGGSAVNSPVWENVARILFTMANNPDSRVVGSIGRAVRAQKIILDRTTGLRRAGTHPARRTTKTIDFVDLTGGGSDGE